jgi:hypothetical protein
MLQKEFQQEFGAGTATTLRMRRPWHGSGRIVIGDSWFASAKTAIQLHKRGLYFLGIIKTAPKNYPIAEARRRCPSERGKCAIATTKINDMNLTCVAWRDKKVQPVKKRRTDESGKIIKKEVPRPKIVEEYFDGAPSIDIHNHIRQSGIALEEIWNTQKWHHRMFASLFGIIETDAYLAFKYFRKHTTIKHSQFTKLHFYVEKRGPSRRF